MTDKQHLRREVLLQLYGSGQIPISAAHITQVCKRREIPATETEVGDTLYFLKGQGFAEALTHEGSGQTRYRITSRGMLEYENNS